MANILKELIVNIILSIICSGMVVYVLRTWISEKLKSAIKASYDEKLEQLKNNLKIASDKEIEQLKSNFALALETHKISIKATADIQIEQTKSSLQIAAAEHSYKFTKLHEQRAEVVAKSYSLYLSFLNAAADYARERDSLNAKNFQENLNSQVALFKQYFRPNRIYLPRSLADKVDEIVQVILNIAHHVGYQFIQQETGKVVHTEYSDAPAQIQRIGEQLTQELEAEFRRLLGDVAPTEGTH
ncbi:hypothetical protein C798_19850 [Herbaspirillum rubrisubalbicans Os34]|uniref:Uncharacterized protein n=1 Tax=Herbaspirillum rubrisubalbicans Os34 TaxID=1235827 RepID=A0A6M3ZWY9_9BURK|nr:hypothetical protein [Herbaspirillum rubrisubalbicans]QJQ02410.1 hypothetical protein C798_19850 [Herbaspirillum rubrisubalbicans Os34]